MRIHFNVIFMSTTQDFLTASIYYSCLMDFAAKRAFQGQVRVAFDLGVYRRSSSGVIVRTGAVLKTVNVDQSASHLWSFS